MTTQPTPLKQALRALRDPLKRLLSGLRVSVRAGPLAGMRISLFSGMRYVRGDYDADQVRMMISALPEGAVVYDIGAHIGYYALAAARRAGPSGMVYAFEPLPLNQRFLRGHIQANGMDTIRLISAAVGAAPGTATFDPGPGSGRGRLSDRGCLRVPVMSLDELPQGGDWRPPTLIKIDVEGAELEVLHGGHALLRRDRPRIMLSVHSERLREQCTGYLTELGYRLDPTRKPNLIWARAD